MFMKREDWGSMNLVCRGPTDISPPVSFLETLIIRTSTLVVTYYPKGGMETTGKHPREMHHHGVIMKKTGQEAYISGTAPTYGQCPAHRKDRILYWSPDVDDHG